MLRLEYAGTAGPDSAHVEVRAVDAHSGARITVVLPADTRRAAQTLDAMTDDMPAWCDLALQRAARGAA